MPTAPDILFEDCAMVGPQCSLKAGNYGFETCSWIVARRCSLVALNFSQPQGTPTDGIVQSVQHANLPWTYGPLGYLLVSPVFHRVHHAIGVGHEGRRHGCNFAVLFPVWDIVFGTADYRSAVEPTGIRDQLPPPQGRGHDYGDGFWRQQWLGLRRMVDPAA